MVNQNPAFAWELRANYLMSLGKKDVEKLIGPKPDYSDAKGDVEDENHRFVQEQGTKVDQKDDHVAHMNGHQQFKREMQGKLTPNALRLITLHILEHRMAYQNGLQEQALIANQSQTNKQEAPSIGGQAPIQGPPVNQGPAVPPLGGY